MPKFYVQLEKKTIWHGYIDAESLGQASSQADQIKEYEDTEQFVQIKIPLHVVTIVQDDEKNVLDHILCVAQGED